MTVYQVCMLLGLAVLVFFSIVLTYLNWKIYKVSLYLTTLMKQLDKHFRL